MASLIEKRYRRHLDQVIFSLIAFLILLILSLLVWNLWSQYGNYKSAIDSVLSCSKQIDHSALLAYAGSWSAAILKTSSLFFSFLTVMVGSLYILRAAASKIDIHAETKGLKGGLSTSSPGLAIMLLGVLLTYLSLSHKTTLEYKTTEIECHSTHEVFHKQSPREMSSGVQLEQKQGE